MASIVKPLAGNEGVAFSRQVLAAGGSKGTGVSIPVDNYQTISFLVEYTRAGVGGGFSLGIEASNDNINWYRIAGRTQAAVVAGADVAENIQFVNFVYQSTGASAERIVINEFPVTGHYMRVIIGETSAFAGTGRVDYFLKGNT